MKEEIFCSKKILRALNDTSKDNYEALEIYIKIRIQVALHHTQIICHKRNPVLSSKEQYYSCSHMK